MINKLIKTFSLLLCFFFVLPCIGCKRPLESKLETDGVLQYYYNLDKKAPFDDETYSIAGNENVTMPDIVYVPAFFNGKPVTCNGFKISTNAAGGHVLYFPCLLGVKRILYPYTMTIYNSTPTNGYEMAEESVISLTCSIDISNTESRKIESEMYDFLNGFYHLRTIYVHRNIYYVCINNDSNYLLLKNNYVLTNSNERQQGKIIQIANTTYLFNYEGSPNEDVFFINNFERGGLIEDVPYKPTREGYEFGGWYKEPECINKWDFELDTLPAPENDNEGELIFKETKLYAKWI